MEVQQPFMPLVGSMDQDLQLELAPGTNSNMDIEMDLDLGPLDGVDDMQLVRSKTGLSPDRSMLMRH